jgi:hypothetical protein
LLERVKASHFFRSSPDPAGRQEVGYDFKIFERQNITLKTPEEDPSPLLLMRLNRSNTWVN